MKFFTANIGAKIFALICACFLWVYVSAGETKVDFFPGRLNIETKNTPDGLAAIYDVQKVKIKIQAPYDTWNRLEADNFKAYVDLSGLDAGTHDVDVKVDVSVPNVYVIEKDPSSITARVETLLKKQVTVKVQFDGEAQTGFIPGETTIKPANVEVKGAKSLIENLTEATAKIKLQGESDDFKKTVPVAIYNEKDEIETGIECTPKNVDVTVPIVRASESKTVGVKVQATGRPASNYYVSKIETTPSTVEISGSNSALKSILYLETNNVDIEGSTQNFQKDIALKVPSGITTKDKIVTVKITLSISTVDKEVSASLAYSNVTPSLSVSSVTSNIIKVVASCPADVASSLSSDKVVITFNLQGMGAGSHFINIIKDNISVPDGCSISSWLPSAVTIVLQ